MTAQEALLIQVTHHFLYDLFSDQG